MCVHADLKLFTRKVDVTKDRIPNWPHDKLTVLAEQPSIFYDLMTDVMLEQVCWTGLLHASYADPYQISVMGWPWVEAEAPSMS